MHREQLPNPNRSPDDLEARLRSLPQPPVPADLETRLLAAIPGERSGSRRRWAAWGGLTGALAAACVLIALARLRHDGKPPVPSSQTSPSAHRVADPSPGPTASMPRLQDDSAGIAAWRDSRRIQEEAEMHSFNWPIKETMPVMVSTKIPPDLFD
jgi:hypothetical protein